MLSGLKHFVTLQDVDKKKQIITTSYNGVQVNSKNCPRNYKAQLKEILNTLNKKRIFHNDIWGPNFVVDEHNIITLIDFGRASLHKSAWRHKNITMNSINKSTSFSDFVKKVRLASFWSGNTFLM